MDERDKRDRSMRSPCKNLLLSGPETEITPRSPSKQQDLDILKEFTASLGKILSIMLEKDAEEEKARQVVVPPPPPPPPSPPRTEKSNSTLDTADRVRLDN